MIQLNVNSLLQGTIRKNQDDLLPQNVGEKTKYEVIAYQVKVMKRKERDSDKEYDSEEIIKIGFVNDAGFLTWVYTSLFKFEQRSEKCRN